MSGPAKRTLSGSCKVVLSVRRGEVGKAHIESRCPPDSEWPLSGILSAVDDVLGELEAC